MGKTFELTEAQLASLLCGFFEGNYIDIAEKKLTKIEKHYLMYEAKNLLNNEEVMELICFLDEGMSDEEIDRLVK